MQSQSCVQCHGEQGKGDGPVAADIQYPPTDFTDPDWWLEKTPNEIFEVTTEGRLDRFMPPWSNQLSEEQIWDTTFYVWSLRTTAEQIQQGQQLFEDQCITCHGESADTPLTNVERYADDSTQDWLQLIQQGIGDHPTFQELSEDEQLAVVEYARTFTYRSPYSALALGNGVVTGQITMGTPSSSRSTSGFSVTLLLLEDNTPTGTKEATADAEGRFYFDQLPTEPGLSYVVGVDYEGFSYYSDINTFDESATELNLSVTIYETTTGASGIQIERLHLILEFEQDTIFVGELYFFSNLADRTYVGTENEEGLQEVLHFTVPSVAQALTVEGGELESRYFRTDTGFFDTQPLPPGQGLQQIVFRYAIPYNSPRLRLIRELLYPVANVNVLVADQGVSVSSPGLTQEGTRGSGGNTYLNLVGTDFAADDNLEVTLDNLPLAQTVSTAATNSSTTLIIGLALGVILIVGSVVYALTRQKRPPHSPAPAVARASDADLQAEKDRLIQSIAALDDAFDASELEEQDYHQQREKLKEALLTVARQLQDMGMP